MDGKTALRHIIDMSGLSQRRISQALGKTPSYISTVLSRVSTPGTDLMGRIADVCGYKLVLRGHGEEVEIDGLPSSGDKR